ncbi:hypothetical protein V8E54_008211 [Elaphomyces granulatus]
MPDLQRVITPPILPRLQNGKAPNILQAMLFNWGFIRLIYSECRLFAFPYQGGGGEKQVLGDQDQCFIVMRLLRDLLSAHEAFRGPSTGPSTGPSKGWSPSCCAPTASRSASGPASRPTSTSTIQHIFYITQCILHTDIIQLELRKIWLEGEARDPAEEVVGAVRCPVPALRLECSLAYHEGW